MEKKIKDIEAYQFECRDCSTVFEIDFSVVGDMPFTTECPSCGVETSSDQCGWFIIKNKLKSKDKKVKRFKIEIILETDDKNVTIKKLLGDSYLFSGDFMGRVTKKTIVEFAPEIKFYESNNKTNGK